MGKTGTMLQLVADGWRYLSDDWTIINSGGVIEPSDKPLEVHPRNLGLIANGERFLIGSLRGSDSIAYRLRRLFGMARRRKVRIEQLFGPDSVGMSGPLTHAVLVRRADVAEFTECPVAASELGSEAARIVRRELSASAGLIGPVCDEVRPGSGRCRDAWLGTENVLAAAFRSTTRIAILVPQRASEREIERFALEWFAQRFNGG